MANIISSKVSEVSVVELPKRARLAEVEQLPLTLLDGKGIMYSTLGSTLAPLPHVVMEVREPGDLHEPTSSSPDLSQFPPAVVVAKAMTRHNRYLQGLDKSSRPSEVDCSSKRLQDIQVDHDISTEGFSMSKQKCKGLRMDSHYKIHSTDLVTDRPVPVDQDMLALVRMAPLPLATLHQWEEVEKSGRALLGIMSMNEYFMADIRHHLEAVRLSEEDPDIPPADKEVLNFPMIRRLTDLLIEATRHITDIAVKQVSQAVFVRWNAYLAKAPLTDRVKKPLRALPLESPKLFAGKMIEALDLDREERKAQLAKQSQSKCSYSGGRQQSSKSGGNNSNSSSRIKARAPEIITATIIVPKRAATTKFNSNRESSSKSSRGGRGKPLEPASLPSYHAIAGIIQRSVTSSSHKGWRTSHPLLRPMVQSNQWSTYFKYYKKWNNSFFQSIAESIHPTSILEQTRQKLDPSVLTYPGDASKRRNRKAYRKVPRILQSPVPGTQEDRRPSSDHQPKNLKQSYNKRKVQDGDTACNQESADPRGLGHLNRPEKRLFWHSSGHPTARKYLRFTHLQEVFQFKALPFGLTSAPREFSRVTDTLGAIAHRQSINLHLYLDDWLLRARSFLKCRQDTATTLRQANSLWFIINEEKSELVPTQQFSFLE